MEISIPSRIITNHFFFLLLGWKNNGHKLFLLFLLQMFFLLNTSVWLQSVSVLLSGDVKTNLGLTHTPKADLLIHIIGLNSIFCTQYIKLSPLKA